MLYLIYGSKEYAKSELRKIREVLLKKRPDALSFRFDEESAESINIDELAEGRGLFEEKFLVELDQVFGANTFEGEEKEALAKMKDSENIFFVLEEKLSKKALDLIRKNAERVSEEKVVKERKKEFTAFSLADALGQRDKQRLWVLLREAVERGYALEEIHGILFWQAKTIVLAHKTSSASEAGMKQFPYSKAKQFTRNYNIEESENLLHNLTQALLDSRRKNIPLEHTLERFVLSI